jgi:hypothetical protein
MARTRLGDRPVLDDEGAVELSDHRGAHVTPPFGFESSLSRADVRQWGPMVPARLGPAPDYRARVWMTERGDIAYPSRMRPQAALPDPVNESSPGASLPV